jgi:hypothetical protein
MSVVNRTPTRKILTNCVSSLAMWPRPDPYVALGCPRHRVCFFICRITIFHTVCTPKAVFLVQFFTPYAPPKLFFTTRSFCMNIAWRTPRRSYLPPLVHRPSPCSFMLENHQVFLAWPSYDRTSIRDTWHPPFEHRLSSPTQRCCMVSRAWWQASVC